MSAMRNLPDNTPIYCCAVCKTCTPVGLLTAPTLDRQRAFGSGTRKRWSRVWGRRSALPSHLKPYFKNSAELDAFVDEQRSAQAKRRKELIDPANSQEAAEYLTLNGHDVVNPVFERALQMLEANMAENPCDYGQLLGEVFASSRAYRNPEKAYYYCYIGLSQDGYSVGFRDENDDPPCYCGPAGDFRNESQVSGLVDELGFDRIKQIDIRATEWLRLNNFDVKDFLEGKDPTKN